MQNTKKYDNVIKKKVKISELEFGVHVLRGANLPIEKSPNKSFIPGKAQLDMWKERHDGNDVLTIVIDENAKRMYEVESWMDGILTAGRRAFAACRELREKSIFG